MSSILDRIKQWFGRTAGSAEERSEGAPVATPPAGANAESDVERETSTNAQVQGASDEPWPGND